ncbi:MAG: branched-chain alpha-keto acid dehydrogenase subunit E2, partial [Actinomycetota bacterium]|nr:branched-chain alpha-keto acid dehydrogenase subunit E2 [Actinomycetota bacterium]
MTEVKVPDIGDFEDVPVIEVLVSEGDEVTEEQGLVTLESEKATMDVPSPVSGTVASIKVSAGDKVSEGAPLMDIDEGGGDEDSGADEAEEKEEEPGADEPEAEDHDEQDEEGDDKPVEEDDEPEAEEDSGADGPQPVRGETQREAEGRDAAAGGRDSSKGPVYAGPGVRRLARELGVDLAGVK